MKRFSATIILVLAALGAVSTQAEAATPVGGKDAAVADTLVNPYSVTIEDNILPDSVEWVTTPWTYGLFIGTGPRWTVGRLNEYFSWAWDFTVGGKVAFRRIYLEAAVSFASPTLRKLRMTTVGAPDEKFRANVKNANYTSWGFNAGYSVYDSRNFSIIPFAGVKWTNYSWTARPLEFNESGDEVMGMPQRKMRVKDLNIDFGVNFDWHFSNIVVSSGQKRQTLMSSLRLTPYAVRGVYSSDQGGFNGWQLGLMIAYSATAKTLKPLYLPE